MISYPHVRYRYPEDGLDRLRFSHEGRPGSQEFRDRQLRWQHPAVEDGIKERKCLSTFGSITTTNNGTAGSAVCGQPIAGGLKMAYCYLSGYQETGTAQTWAFPTPFNATPVLLESGGSCGTYNPSVSATMLTLPANASMAAETCDLVILGN